MRRGGAHAPIFNKKTQYGAVTVGAQVGVPLVSVYCGFMGGTASTQGTDSLHGGSASTVGSDVINANASC